MSRVARRFYDEFRRYRQRASRLRHRLSGESTLAVFMYHRVTDEATRDWGPWRYDVTPETFEAHICRIASRYEVVGMDDVLAVLGGDRPEFPESAAVVTFDDGYEDTLREAVPVLERYGVPATVYVSTALLGSDGGPFVFRLANALERIDTAALDVPSLDADLPSSLPGDTRQAYERLRRPAKWVPSAVRQSILEAVEGANPVQETPMLSGPQVRTLSDHDLVTVGAHGHDHVPLTTLSEIDMRDNVDESTTRLSNLLGERPVHFSYPYGANDERVRSVVADAGYETAVTTGPAVARTTELTNSRYEIPRIDSATFL